MTSKSNGSKSKYLKTPLSFPSMEGVEEKVEEGDGDDDAKGGEEV